MWKVSVVSLLISYAVLANPVDAIFTQEITNATNQFSLDLLKAIQQDHSGNSVVSPVSVYTLLAILQQGAGGSTRQEVNNVVHAQPELTKESYHSLTTRYKSTFPGTELEFAMNAFADYNFSLKPDFKQTLVDNFNSGIDSVHFSNPDNSSAHINSWVSEHTHQKISQLFQPSDLESGTVLVLVNAIYFKSYWDRPFFTGVSNKSFSPSNGVEIYVPTLELITDYVAGECSHIGAKYVHLDFLGTSDFTVLLILPTERHGLNALLNHLSAENLTNIFSHTEKRKVTLQFPKFRLKSDTNLVSVLQRLGLNEAFEDTANLSGITDQAIKLSKAIQKAEIKADEGGVTAAAATGFALYPTSLHRIPNLDEMDFIADHPFLFFIVDRTNHVPLFAGRVMNPSIE